MPTYNVTNTLLSSSISLVNELVTVAPNQGSSLAPSQGTLGWHTTVSNVNAPIATSAPGAFVYNGGGASDTVIIKNLDWYLDNSIGAYVYEISVNAGDDFISLERSAARSIHAGAGNDHLILNGSFASKADMGAGNDTVAIGADDTLEVSYDEVAQKNNSNYSAGELDGGAGTDELRVWGDFTITLGAGSVTLDTDNDGIGDVVTNVFDYQNISMIIGWPTVALRGTIQWPDVFGIKQQKKFTNFETIQGICFTQGTKIETPNGLRNIEDLNAGDLVVTCQGVKPIKWIAKRSLDFIDLSANSNLLPVRVPMGALGEGLPRADLRFSPQHRIIVCSTVAGKMFRDERVLTACKHLVGFNGIEIDGSARSVVYYHMVFDEHCTVMVEGIEVETLYRGKTALSFLTPDGLNELRSLFSDIDEILDGTITPQSCALILSAREAKALIARHKKQKILHLYR